MTIELIDKIIKIPAGENVIISTENNPKTVIIKIPRELLTTQINNSQVFILTQLNEEEVETEELTYLTDSLFYVYYQWKITNKHTYKEGKLAIQIKILRNIPIENAEEANQNFTNENVDPDFSRPVGLDEDGIWLSYKNEFKILEVLKPLL